MAAQLTVSTYYGLLRLLGICAAGSHSVAEVPLRKCPNQLASPVIAMAHGLYNENSTLSTCSHHTVWLLLRTSARCLHMRLGSLL